MTMCFSGFWGRGGLGHGQIGQIGQIEQIGQNWTKLDKIRYIWTK